jgi:hypothetical protein
VTSELTSDFIELFYKLPERVRKTARKNYKLWKQNPFHPGLEFKKINKTRDIYSVRIGIGWRALGILKDNKTIIWFWVGPHSKYNELLKQP